MTESDHSRQPQDPATEARLLFAASELNADLLYATRFFAPDPFACFLHGGRSHVVMNDLEIDRARRQARVDEVLSLSGLQQELGREGRRAITTAAVLQRLLAARGVRTLLVPFDFPAGLAFQLRRRGFRVRVKEGPSSTSARSSRPGRSGRSPGPSAPPKPASEPASSSSGRRGSLPGEVWNRTAPPSRPNG